MPYSSMTSSPLKKKAISYMEGGGTKGWRILPFIWKARSCLPTSKITQSPMSPQEVGVAHAGNLNRVLKRQEDAFARPFVRLDLQQVFAFVDHFAFGDLVRRVAGEHFGQRAFARTRSE